MNDKNSALLLIDLQKEDGTEIVGMERILQNTKRIIDQCRGNGIPIFYTRHICRSDSIALANQEPVTNEGAPLSYASDTESIEIVDTIKPNQEDIVIDKYRYSAFFESNLDFVLRSLGIEHLIVAGVLTDCCVMSTVYDAYFRNYQVNLIEDACGTSTVGAHMAATLIMSNWIYDLVVFNTVEFINMLEGKQYSSWSSTEPDELQFGSDNMKHIFSHMKNKNSLQTY